MFHNIFFQPCCFFFFFFFDIKRLNFSIYFLKSFVRIFNSLSFCNRPWFSSPMHWFNKNVVFYKQQIYSVNALKSLLSKACLLPNFSDALSPVLVPAAKSVNTGEKGELRKSLMQLSFLLLFFVLFILAHISLIFPRLVLNLYLSIPANFRFNRLLFQISQ